MAASGENRKEANSPSVRSSRSTSVAASEEEETANFHLSKIGGEAETQLLLFLCLGARRRNFFSPPPLGSIIIIIKRGGRGVSRTIKRNIIFH